ncbi:MAG TPA: AMP-binding protein [Gemmataceae bacterium]|nr:AMP-binding protein [Gemmataceae bacterium]
MMYQNLAELHRCQAERLGPLPALRFKRHGLYGDLTWDDYRADALALAAALIDVGIQPGDRVGLLAENRVEWLIADMGILAAAAVNVPPHAPLTARQVHYQLREAGVRWLIVSTRAQLDKIRQVRADLPELKGLVLMEGDAPAEEAISWRAFLQRGRRAAPRLAQELRRREEQLGPADLATIMYTSGTTGNPKGVMLTHGNLLSNSLAALEVMPHGPGDLVLNWLPLTHIYARTVDHYLCMAAGTPVALAESAETLVQNLEDVQPTLFASVPRFYEKVLSSVRAVDAAETGRRLRQVFGPRIDWMSSGGAPLPPAIARTYAAAGLLLLQGYGLTETAPILTFNCPKSYKVETVGRPLPGVELRIASDGEILTRGPNVMKGYWNDPAATAATIRDGWLHTGDLGELDAEGFLRITGRKKDLLVLSNGKKVAPACVEGLLLADPCIDQVVVCGEGRTYLCALLVPSWDNVRRALREEGVALDSGPEDWARRPEVRGLIERRVRRALMDLCGAEQVKKFLLLPRPFSVAADELTVSLKLRRNVVLDRYKNEIEDMYRE